MVLKQEWLATSHISSKKETKTRFHHNFVLHPLVIFGAVNARVDEIFKIVDEIEFRMQMHPCLNIHNSLLYKAKFA